MLTISNKQILEWKIGLENLIEQEKIYLPVKANFFIQKNFNLLAQATQEIEVSRLQIAEHYGTLDESQQQYIVPEEYIKVAGAEITELFELEQSLDIHMIKLEELGHIELTPKQMQALMFMIEE